MYNLSIMRRHNTVQNLKFLHQTIYRRDHDYAGEPGIDTVTRKRGRRVFGAIVFAGVVALAPAAKGCADGGGQLIAGNPNEPTEQGAVTPRDTSVDTMTILDCGQLSLPRPPTATELQVAAQLMVLSGGEWAADFNCLGIDPDGDVASVTGAAGAECAFVDSDTAVCRPDRPS
ncbi:MAG TPA: hypothetical protein VK694_05395 [Verrucomicrobiae bacterium]|nr:hypothetical protein [Verrucomicrobiae bacterium]